MIERVRRSQLIFSSGPGAIVDLSDFSGIVMGLEHWSLERVNRMPRSSRSGFQILFYPPTITKSTFGRDERTERGRVPVKRFPQWVQCSNPQCSTFGHYKDVSSRSSQSECLKCDHKLVPARLIRICRMGHMDDLPWDQFYHGDSICELKHPKYRLIARDQQSGSLEDLILLCACNLHPQGRSLGEVYQFALGLKCRGRRPWLSFENEFDEGCTHKNEIVMRGASNVYFPVVRSELTIPSIESAIQKFVAEKFAHHLTTIRSLPTDGLKRELVKNLITNSDAASLQLDRDQMTDRILEMASSSTGVRMERKSEIEIRKEEFDILNNPQVVRVNIIPKVYNAREVDVDGHIQRLGISKLIAVDRLQETRILEGFRRVDPAAKKETLVDIGQGVNGQYPAIEVNGEGLFLSVDEAKLTEWESRGEVRDHCDRLVKHSTLVSGARELPFPIMPRAIMLHGLAHSLIKMMGLLGGYSSVAIREKIYAGRDYNGILLYTGETDSEGTMGGIVSLADKSMFSILFLEALEDARWCSSDPLCRENGQDKDHCENLAACHACLFLAETSCELSNRFLDRSLVVSNRTGLGFFT